MFCLLTAADKDSSTEIPWQLEFIAPPSTLQEVQEKEAELSFLDRLAAPTVFLQQAFLFDTALDVAALRASVSHVVQQYPSFAHRLTKNQVGV